MAEDQPKDWEKEYVDNFNKKIPFPMHVYESVVMNPAMDGIIYTMANASVHDDTNFELYMEADTADQVNEIVEELKKKDADSKGKAKEETKKDKKKDTKEDTKDEVNVDEAEPEPAVKPKTETKDYIEMAIMELNKRRLEESKSFGIG